MNKHTDPALRHDVLLLVDVTNGNPNGDPDHDNAPRINYHTGKGFITRDSIQRKVKDEVLIRHGSEEGYDLYVKQRGILALENASLFEQEGIEPPKIKGHKDTDIKDEAEKKSNKKEQKLSSDKVSILQQAAKQKYFDARLFGAMLNSGKDGKMNVAINDNIQGAFHFVDGNSIDRILPIDMGTLRAARTNRDEGQETQERASNGQFGRRAIVPYGLYLFQGFYDPQLGKKNGVTGRDLEYLWEATMNMFQHCRSSQRGWMTTRKVIIFTHENPYGNMPDHQLFGRLAIEKNTDTPTKFKDYDVQLSISDLEEKGVHVTVLE